MAYILPTEDDAGYENCAAGGRAVASPYYLTFSFHTPHKPVLSGQIAPLEIHGTLGQHRRAA